MHYIVFNNKKNFITNSSGGYGRKEQVPDQWNQRAEQEGLRPVLLRAAEREQPSLPHHAGPDH